MSGGAGDDAYRVDSARDVVVEAADEGHDSVRASLSWRLGDHVEDLQLWGRGRFWGSGNDLDNALSGNRAGNVLSGKDGDDTLAGRGGDDKLWGGAGDDRFVFDTGLGGNNVDRICDFGNGDDTIVLASPVFATLAAGALDAGAFRIGAAAADASDRVVYDDRSGALFYDADGSGAGAAVQFATLARGLALTTDDFEIV